MLDHLFKKKKKKKVRNIPRCFQVRGGSALDLGCQSGHFRTNSATLFWDGESEALNTALTYWTWPEAWLRVWHRHMACWPHGAIFDLPDSVWQRVSLCGWGGRWREDSIILDPPGFCLTFLWAKLGGHWPRCAVECPGTKDVRSTSKWGVYNGLEICLL